jgi:hypothetical protein
MDAAASGASMVLVELPAMITGEADAELADQLVWTIPRVLERSARTRDVEVGVIGVACTHVSQVNAVLERLGPDLSGVFVETANRFQGLERSLMFVHHPLSDRADATDFHPDAGRLCVMLSRHRIACWIFAREGIGRQLRRYAPTGDRVLGISDDPEYAGWRAHTELMNRLLRRSRRYAVPGRGNDRRRAG